jgi:hypothetical protein
MAMAAALVKKIFAVPIQASGVRDIFDKTS